MRESEVEKIFTDMVRSTGGMAYKWTSPGNAGVPDRIVIFPDKKPVFVELKTDTGKLTKLQKVQCKRLIALGQKVEVVYGIKGVALFFFQLGYKDIAEKLIRQYRIPKDSFVERTDTGWNL